MNGVGWLDAYTHPRIVTTPGQEGGQGRGQGPGGTADQGQDNASCGQAAPGVGRDPSLASQEGQVRGREPGGAEDNTPRGQSELIAGQDLTPPSSSRPDIDPDVLQYDWS